MRSIVLMLALGAAVPAWGQALVTTPAPACAPASMVAGQWWHDYAVTTADGQDTYRGQAVDCTGFALSVPAGTAACKALGTGCPVQATSQTPAAQALQALVSAGLLTADQAAKALQ